MTLLYIFISTFLISLIAFIGVLTLFLREKLLEKILSYLVAFSAGALIGGAFLHLIPEAISQTGSGDVQLLKVFLSVLLGFCVFFILEQFIRWHHRHDLHCHKVKPFSYLILVSDAIHNFIDGLIIAGSFVVSIPVGIITALAVALHEIPQELGDFGILIYGGFKKSKALLLNFFSAVFAILGGIVGFFLAEKIGDPIVYLLPFAAGNFIYISATDLIPEIRHDSSKKPVVHFSLFLFGIVLMLLLKLI